MGTKTLSITNDVYERLKGLKLKGESFSDTIRRLTDRGTISEFAGLWKSLPDEEFEKLREAIDEVRASANRDLEGRIGEDDLR